MLLRLAFVGELQPNYFGEVLLAYDTCAELKCLCLRKVFLCEKALVSCMVSSQTCPDYAIHFYIRHIYCKVDVIGVACSRSCMSVRDSNVWYTLHFSSVSIRIAFKDVLSKMLRWISCRKMRMHIVFLCCMLWRKWAVLSFGGYHLTVFSAK